MWEVSPGPVVWHTRPVTGMRGIIIDGLTGAGKTRVLNALIRLPDFAVARSQALLYDEDATMGGTLVPGDVMDELGDAGTSDAFRWRRLEAVLSALETSPGRSDSGRFLVERFHLTYHVLMPDEGLFAAIDSRLGRLGAGLVLLTYPDSEIPVRALHRPDRAGTLWLEEMTHGRDESGVVDELRYAARKYRDALAFSKLPSMIIDTESRDWEDFARQILMFAGR